MFSDSHVNHWITEITGKALGKTSTSMTWTEAPVFVTGARSEAHSASSPFWSAHL